MKVRLLGVDISVGTSSSLLREASELLLRGRSSYIVTPNPEFIVRATKDLHFKEILNKASLAIPDGIGLIWASRLLNKPLPERVAGADFGQALVELAARTQRTVFFLGGRGDVAAKAAGALSLKYPGLRVAGSWSGEGLPGGDLENLERIGPGRIGLLLVAYGHPKQEYWIARNLSKLNVGVAMGVGGSFDYWSGEVSRAPLFIRRLGLEWLFRLIRQPWRVRRQLALVKFIYLVFREKFRK